MTCSGRVCRRKHQVFAPRSPFRAVATRDAALASTSCRCLSPTIIRSVIEDHLSGQEIGFYPLDRYLTPRNLYQDRGSVTLSLDKLRRRSGRIAYLMTLWKMKQPASARIPTFEPIQSLRAFEIVCERIREQVADGRLKRGDKLPPERLLAEQLGVSRLAIREALRSLENAGLVVLERGPKGGAFIQGGSDGKMTELMQDMMALGTITLSDLTEARIFILDSVARLACERATEEDIRLIEENVKMNEVAIETGSRETRLAHATEFYERLAFATKNRVMMLVVRSLTDTIREVLQRIEIYPSKEFAQSRWQFMRALKARNAERAAQEMSSHLRKLHEHIVRHAAAQKKSPDIRPRSRP